MHLFEQPATVEIPVSANGRTVSVVVDPDVADTLGKRRLSLGSHGYAQGFFGGRVTLLHRWLVGCEPRDGYIVDHINRDPLDCRRANLRFVNPVQNTENRAVVANPLAGTYQARNGRWKVKVQHRWKNYHLGTYDTREEAAEVARAFRRQHFTALPEQ
jgi:hypothetical protein